MKAQNIIVDCNGYGNYTTIHDAINNATPGQTIYVWDGTYNDMIYIDIPLTLIGNGTKKTIINGSGIGSVVEIVANWVNITGFTIQNSGDNINDAGIKLFGFNCNISGNIILKNIHGIVVCTNNNIIYNNSITNNKGIGIDLQGADWNILINNNCSYNDASGIYLYSSHSNIISDNTCNYNQYDGIQVNNWPNKILNNTCISNKNNGINFHGSSLCIVLNNICNSNYKDGIYYDSSWYSYTSFINNTCNLNGDDGIEIRESAICDIKNNTCILNLDTGMELFDTGKIIFLKNNISSNKIGINLVKSIYNNLSDNNINKNEFGIYLEQTSLSNIFNDNFVSANTNTGIFISSTCNDNLFYHNQILFNAKQAIDYSKNNWSNQNEGNYWSDYSGLDNGANGRWKGDGIGDTNLPHPGQKYDNYPFIEPFGWQFPATPELIIESELDSDGNYTVSWSNRSRADGYIFEEDTDPSFNSPEVYNNGWIFETELNMFYFKHRTEDTYHYRIRSFKDLELTDWSDIVNVTVDYLPMIPKNLCVESIPEGNALKIYWDPNQKDTVRYGLYCFYDQTWDIIENVTHPINSYIHEGLVDGLAYTYRISAIDANGQSSGFSENVTGIPNDIVPPDTPKGLSATPISDSEIELTWDANSEQDLSGYLIYINDSETDQSFGLNKTLIGKQTSCIITGLNEQITYYFKIKAFDEVPNNSSLSEVACATTPDETYPVPPTGLKISNITYKSLILSWKHNPEPDILGYIVYRSTSLIANYKNITEIVTTTYFNDTKLEENTFYYYKIKAVDDADLISLFSDYIFAQTLLGPRPPEINNSISDFDIKEDTIDQFSIKLYYLFKDINNDPMVFKCQGQNHINVMIEQISGSVTLTPKTNWNGQETLTFYANDTIFETGVNITVTVTSVNDPPGVVKIIIPIDNSRFNESDSIDFQGICTDPDLLYGDELTFTWSSQKDGELGKGENLTGVKLSPGRHFITLKVNDIDGKVAKASINITILEKEDGKDQDDNNDHSFAIIIGVGLIIIIIIIIISLLLLIKRKKKHEKLSSKQVEPKSEQLSSISGGQPIEPVHESIQTDIQQQLYLPQEPEIIKEQSIEQLPLDNESTTVSDSNIDLKDSIEPSLQKTTLKDNNNQMVKETNLLLYGESSKPTISSEQKSKKGN